MMRSPRGRSGEGVVEQDVKQKNHQRGRTADAMYH